MRVVVLLICLSFGSILSEAQVTTDSVYLAVESKPIFPGCDTTLVDTELSTCSTRNLYSWVSQNLKYPPSAREANITGTVVLSFVVNIDGTVTDPKIIKSPDQSLSDEGIRLVETTKEEITWSPAIQKDQTVRYRYVLPIKFNLGYTNNKELFLVFNAWGDVEVFRGMVPARIQDKIPGKFIKNVQTFDFQKSKAVYNVIGKAHIINFKRNKLALPQELKGLKPKETHDLNFEGLKVQYISSADQLNLSMSDVNQSGRYYVHNYIGDILHQGKFKRSNGLLEKIDASSFPDGVLFVSFVQKEQFATTLAVKE